MTRLLIPNSMQLPNVLVDEVMPVLKPAAVKVLLIIARFTLGYGKIADRISLTHFQRLTGLSRIGVTAGVEELQRHQIITVKQGAKGVGSNQYALNINFETGELVRKAYQSEKLTSKVGSQKTLLFQTHPNRRLVPIGTKAPIRAPRVPDPRVKSLIGSFCSKYEAKTSKAYVPIWGKDGQLLKGLLSAGLTPEAIEASMDLYFADEFAGRTGFDIGRFVNSFNRVNSAKASESHPDGKRSGLNRVVAPPGKYDAFK